MSDLIVHVVDIAAVPYGVYCLWKVIVNSWGER
jgi:hypothetical protein